ncbi:dimethyladenosine transferase 2, mitochondrial [Neodiprion virginianus]|uniref:dimethyladenosine transferase 2, mitochondrial n=1 Tax=Neodiprion fabricii TaxID=2872261 RepID=UPI001ED8F9A0|nr:dimethyladenosine transferase 2, mitochondrial [Neodiprion fabricii]XP_046435010.1 dimethyladenosine transferase 2, mitochondrial [Neodiprion fabricii]XP_046435011.1 dimethyladenosine transferase 2, mitochondrial [Neodiprion fabricii]XP_046628421.1 dimethyladenosine transferase 2, mitochondrial [Neodiprion virginianus]XP_046628422.1 dimethyladenosine transferase 2, mitochondrial [Neodiprion virginianus]XP_046628423.1 dimethyladenosine transferase 2, mitochondrial [Neodiprion virginianus]
MIGIKTKAGFLFRRFITSKISKFIEAQNVRGGRYAKFCTVSVDQPPRRTSVPLGRRRVKAREKILEYFSGTTLQEHIDDLPINLMNLSSTNSEHLYLCHDGVASQVVNLIQNDLMTDSSKVIEMNPGMGCLTKKIMDAGIQFLKALEPNEKFEPFLMDLSKEYPDKLTIDKTDFMSFWKLVHLDKYDEVKRVAQLLPEFSRVPWGDKPGLKVVGTVSDTKFVSFVMMDIIRQSKMYSYGRPCLYLCLPPRVWEKFTCDGSTGLVRYTSLPILFQTIFDYKLLGQVPRKAFLPWQLTPMRSDKGKKTRTEEYMYVVGIEGKKNLFSEVIDERLLQAYWFFVHHNMYARTSKVIQQMEAWEPGCGPALIKQGFNVFTQFGDLTSEDILKIFKEFSTWHSFGSSFIPCMENSSQKMETLFF